LDGFPFPKYQLYHSNLLLLLKPNWTNCLPKNSDFNPPPASKQFSDAGATTAWQAGSPAAH
jgi:hypothetical protein